MQFHQLQGHPDRTELCLKVLNEFLILKSKGVFKVIPKNEQWVGLWIEEIEKDGSVLSQGHALNAFELKRFVGNSVNLCAYLDRLFGIVTS